ncbi:MAG: heparan-alpha-glucosaminide N-acetyltransferase [Paracoccaceae bacterium]
MRVFLLDITRGICVLAMIAYHFCWDLGYFGFIDLRLITQGFGLLIAQLIGLSFITIAGISSRILSLSDSFEQKFLKRFLKLVFISAIISIVTFILNRNSFIFFGILHFLSVCSLISLILVYIKSSSFHLLLIFLCAAIISISRITFNLPFMLSWLGFNREIPTTNDFYPLFPWITFYFFGFWFGKIFYEKLNQKDGSSPMLINEKSIFFKFFEYMGQKALVIYILHQPILFSLFFVFIKVASGE